jgi:methionyl-tRNA formyltransferase
MNTQKKIRVIFFGTPEFSVSSLKSLNESEQIDIIAVVTQEGKPKGRGKLVTDTPIAIESKNLNLKKIIAPKNLKKIISDSSGVLHTNNETDKDLIELTEVLNSGFDFGIVVAYGKIIPVDILNKAKFCFLNLHPSALPRWRGAAPLQHTILAGDKSSSICIIKLIDKLDAGPIYKKFDFQLDPEETFGTLYEKTSLKGASLLVETCLEIFKKEIIPYEQSELETTYAEKWEKKDCLINWHDPASLCLNRIKASNPKPGAYTFLNNKIIKIHKAKIYKEKINISGTSANGTLYLSIEGKLIVKCNNIEFIEPLELQIEGKNKISANDFLNNGNLKDKLRLKEPIFFSTN